MIAIVDIIIAGIVILFAYIGVRRGLMNEIIALVFLVAAVMLPLLFADNVMDMFYRPASSDIDQVYRKVIYGLVFALMVVGILLAGMFARALAKQATDERFTVMNHVLGGVFGFARGCIVCIALISAVDLMLPDYGMWSRDSELTHFLQPIADYIGEQFPDDYLRHRSDFDVEELFR